MHDPRQQYASMPISDALRALGTSRDGLSDEEAASRLRQYGLNELTRKKQSLLLLFLKQFQSVMVFILFGALALTLALPFFEEEPVTVASFLDAIVIFAILILNAILGFVQEYKAEEAVKMLEKLSSPQAVVRRGGEPRIIPSREIVHGDVVLLETGDKVSADGRVIDASHIEVNESLLTGESASVSKTTDPVREGTTLADRKSMVFSGTLVTRGAGEYVVTATGMQTEIGGIAALVAAVDFPETPLQRRLKRLGVVIGVVILLITTAIILVGWIKQIAFADILLIGASLAVSAVPEGLPAVMTVCLALGVRRMVKANAIVRRLDALETLGSVTVICADKTGTITENRMRVRDMWTPDGSNEDAVLLACASCSRARLPDIGDPTEIGLLEEARDRNIERLPIDEEVVPFSSEDMYMRTRHGDRDFLKGAPEKILSFTPDADRDAALAKNDAYASQGLRVLAAAEARGEQVRFLGLVALEDPPREGTAEAREQASHAGIRTIMITGDNLTTATAIAERVGLRGNAVLGRDIDDMPEEELRKTVRDTAVFARVTPVQKVTILTALQKNGEIVAMSGDGVNDAPALKQAHVGIAMGKNGTDVAREAASIVLADDHYATIVAAVREGRRIYDNIRKFVLFLLRCNFYQLFFIATAIMAGLPLPYLPIHILWINLVTDGLPALALSAEKAEPDVMNRPPRPATEPILSGEWTRLILAAVFGYLLSLFFFLWHLHVREASLEEARTLTLTLAIMFELFLVFSVRSRRPLWEVGVFSNRWLLGAVAVPFTFHLLFVLTPLRSLFSFALFPPGQWALMFVLCAVSLLFFEMMKLTGRKES